MVALKTFTNLPIDRQTEIIAVCLEEFALHEYRNASLSTIVANLNLAKGSFYRYFENKQSLYFYLLDYCTQTRLKNDSEFIKIQPSDIFELILLHFEAKIQFDKKSPLQSAFLQNVLEERNNDELGNIQLKSKSKILAIIKSLVSEQIKKGKLRNDMDIDIMAFMILQTQISMFDFIAVKHKIDFRERIKSGKKLHSISDKKMLEISKQFVAILRNGMKVEPLKY